MRKKRKRKPKTEKQKIKDRLDELLRIATRLRDNDTCQHCGKRVSGSDSHTAHIVSKAQTLWLRWDLLNVLVLCTHCHFQWWHAHPLEAGEWFRQTFPARQAYLETKRQEKRQTMRVSDLLAKEQYLKDKIEELKNEPPF